MPSFLSKVTKLASSPKGKAAIEQARRKATEMAKDPATRAKIDAATGRVRSEVDKRRGGSRPAATGTGSADDQPPAGDQDPTTAPPVQPPVPPTQPPPAGSR